MGRLPNKDELKRLMDEALPGMRRTYLTLEATRRHCPDAHTIALKNFKDKLWRSMSSVYPEATREEVDGYAHFLLEALRVRYARERVPQSPEELEELFDMDECRRVPLNVSALLSDFPDRE